MNKRMGFKELLQQDAKNVFLNPAEFGEAHAVNGKEMAIVIDNYELSERQKHAGQHTDGVYADQKLIYVAASDFGPLPSQGSKFILDGATFFVEDAIAEGDIYSITINANKGRGRR